MSRVSVTCGRHGVVLIVVMWMLVILTVLCLALHGMVMAHIWQTVGAGEHDRSDQGIRSALAMARDVVAADGAEVDCLGDLWATGGEAMFSGRIDGGDYRVLAEVDGVVRYGLTDEAARLNANTASVEMLEQLPGMDADAAVAFVAARDALAARIAVATADLAGPGSGLTGPIADPSQLSRMLTVAMANAIAIAPGSTAPAWHNGRQWPTPVADVMEHLTIYSRAWNRDAAGNRRINLNTAGSNELSAALGGALSPLQIKALVRSRDDQPFTSIGDMLVRPIMARDDDALLVTVVIAPATFGKIADRITVTDALVLPGRVNVNTAGEHVLAALPGMTDESAERVVGHRETLDPAELASVGWLLGILPPQQFQLLAPHATCRTGQFRLRMAYRGDDATVASYAEAVVERNRRSDAVLYLERYRRIWDDPRSALAGGAGSGG